MRYLSLAGMLVEVLWYELLERIGKYFELNESGYANPKAWVYISLCICNVET